MSILKSHNLNVAVLVPCYNEERTISRVVRDFKERLPNSSIYVYDNNSNDNTRAEAENAGAIVRKEQLQGKGNVVRRMFADVEADIYFLVDGDNTQQYFSLNLIYRFSFIKCEIQDMVI